MKKGNETREAVIEKVHIRQRRKQTTDSERQDGNK
jgi:hypothetical protein